MRMLLIVFLGFAMVLASPTKLHRIVGGSVTTIMDYPIAALILFSWSGSDNFIQNCGGSIINNRAVLSAAHCFIDYSANQFRIRVGSSYASSGGTVHLVRLIIIHSSYIPSSLDNDIAILYSSSSFHANDAVGRGVIAGPNYNVADNQVVWAIGWGSTESGGPSSEQLRHVQIWTVNQEVCRSRYAALGFSVTDNMLCSGWLDIGGRDQCQGDSGGPLLHNNVIVGICSWGRGCGQAHYPGVSVRVSRYVPWIQANA